MCVIFSKTFLLNSILFTHTITIKNELMSQIHNEVLLEVLYRLIKNSLELHYKLSLHICDIKINIVSYNNMTDST